MGTILSWIGGNEQADAADRGAKLQDAATKKMLEMAKSAVIQQQDERNRGVEMARKASAKSVDEIAAVQRLTSDRDKFEKETINRLHLEDQALNDVDPLVKESGQQVLKLLQGKEAEVMGPVRTQRENQKRQLENQLAVRLGPGFRTTTAGLTALNKFDESTALVYAQTQSQALTQVTGVFQTATAQKLAYSQTAGALRSSLNETDKNILSFESGVTDRTAKNMSAVFANSPVDFMAPVQAQGAVAGQAANMVLGDLLKGKLKSEVGAGQSKVAMNIIGGMYGSPNAGKSAPDTSGLASGYGQTDRSGGGFSPEN